MLAETASPSIEDLHVALKEIMLRSCPRLSDDSLTTDRRFTDLGLASVEVMCMIFEVEEAYALDIVGPGLDDFETLGELALLVRSLIAKRKPAV